MLNFRKLNGEKIPNLENYIVDIVINDPTVIVAIGCDSQQKGSKTCYGIAIVFWSPVYRKGAHFIYSKNYIPRQRDKFTRLWKEAEYLLEIGNIIDEYLRKINYKKPQESDNRGRVIVDHSVYKLCEIHLDLNPDDTTGSYSVYKAASPWLKSEGFKTLEKPDAYSATYAADRICR